MYKHHILGIHVTDHLRDAAASTTSRPARPVPRLLILELVDDGPAARLAAALRGVNGVDVQEMVFDHPA